jgi:hypothetical protein
MDLGWKSLLNCDNAASLGNPVARPHYFLKGPRNWRQAPRPAATPNAVIRDVGFLSVPILDDRYRADISVGKAEGRG